MISLVRAAWQEELRTPMFVGLSTDGFPAKTDPAMKNGARCYHMDTAKEYEYSAEDEQWYEVPQSGGGGGGGGLPPVTGSGKALVSVNGEWKQQEGFPYDEGETAETKFDETFTNFTRDTEEYTDYLYPIDMSDVNDENNVTIDGVTYFYVDSSTYNYIGIESCTVRAQDGHGDWPSGLEFVQSGGVKKVAIPYSIEQYDPETGEPVDPLTGTLYGVAVPTDGAQDADGNTFPAAGFYCTVNGDLSDTFVGVERLELTYFLEWVSEHPVDEPLPDYEVGKNYRVYLDGEIAEGGDFSGSIDFRAGYVSTDDDGEGGYKAVCYVYADNHETAPESIGIKLEEIVSGVHPMDGKLLFGENVQDGTALVSVGGEMTKQYGYAYRTPEEWREFSSHEFSGFIKTSYNALVLGEDYDFDEREIVVEHYKLTTLQLKDYTAYQSSFNVYALPISGDVKKTWVFVIAPIDGAADEEGNIFPVAGVYSAEFTEYNYLLDAGNTWVSVENYWPGSGDSKVEIDGNQTEAVTEEYDTTYIDDFGDEFKYLGNGVSLLVLSGEHYETEPDSVLVQSYEMQGGTVPFDSDFIPWDEIPSEDIPWYDAPEGTGLPEPTYEDGTYILQATESDGEMSYEWAQGGSSGTVITAENNTTINTYQVPQLTTEQIQAAYNAVAAGKSVTIIDATETMMFSGLNADVVSDEIFISFRYFDKMFLEYDGNGTINYTTIVSATEVQSMIDAAIGNAIGGAY